MSILSLCKPSEKIIRQIGEVETACKIHDNLHGSLSLDVSLNLHPDMKSLFLLCEGEKLISFLSIFMPGAQEAEISAYTLPNDRRKGYFNQLLREAKEELKQYTPLDLLFVCEPQSQDGREVVEHLGAVHAHTEYLMYCEETAEEGQAGTVHRVSLRPAQIGDLDSLARLSQEIFRDSYEDAKSLIEKILSANNRMQYAAIFQGRLIGMASVCIEDESASIFGVGISPEHRGKGFGKELMCLILEELRAKGIADITLEVASDNQIAYNLYKQCGFTQSSAFGYYRVLCAPQEYRRFRNADAMNMIIYFDMIMILEKLNRDINWNEGFIY